MRLFPPPNFFDSLVKPPEGLSSSSCPRTDQSLLASRFVQCKYVVCLELAFCRLPRGAGRVFCVHLLVVRPTTSHEPFPWGADYKDKGNEKLPNSRLTQTHGHSEPRQPVDTHAGTTIGSQLPIPPSGYLLPLSQAGVVRKSTDPGPRLLGFDA